VVTVLLLAAAPAALAQHGDPAGSAAADPHAHHRAMARQGASGAAGATELDVTDLGHAMDIPDVTVVDQTGAERHFYRDLVAGKTVAVNFVFTTCTTICPPMGANFGRLRRELGERAGRDLHLISVSVDPVTDTPERLAAWAEKFGAGDGWTLVTGERGEITRLLKALEVFTPDVNDHSPVVLIGNDDAGNWTRAHGLAPPAKLEELLQQADAEAAAEAEAEGRG
jgi:cytochrome oxidase Cu insertion factor (SCO1/SenC/PrrC family)